MKSPDHPDLEFVQASGYTRGRPDGPPLWIVVHDMEASEHSSRAESTAAYFANPSDGRSVSAHYTADDNSVVQCVLLRDTAWTVGNRPGNNRGINWEFAGFASQTRAQWLDAFGLAMFRRAAPYIRADAAEYGIPLERRTVAELKAFKPGVTSHNDLRLAFGVTTHTDPGPNFPWDVFLDILQEDDMPLSDADAKKVALEVWRWFGNPLPPGVSAISALDGAYDSSKVAAEKPPADAAALAHALITDPAFTAALEAAAEKAVRKVAADAAS